MNMYEDYLMLLSPPETVKHEIARYKKASAKLIGSYQSMDAPAHISIRHLERQKPFMMETNLKQMELSLNTLPQVLLHVDGFNYFTHLHNRMTIYARIRPTPAADEWFKQLKKILNIKKTLIPHITITRNIAAHDFNLLWPHLRHKKLVEPFWIKELKIVKRETFGNPPKWEFFKSFAFNGLIHVKNNCPADEPAETRPQLQIQTSLFKGLKEF